MHANRSVYLNALAQQDGDLQWAQHKCVLPSACCNTNNAMGHGFAHLNKGLQNNGSGWAALTPATVTVALETSASVCRYRTVGLHAEHQLLAMQTMIFDVEFSEEESTGEASGRSWDSIVAVVYPKAWIVHVL